jgi:hypothetical protein
VSWWQSPTHPIWRLAEFAVIAFAIAFAGSESLDVKDYAAVLGAILYGRARSAQ